MFKSKEELKKIYTDSTYSFGFNDGIVEGIDKTWKSFAERVEFYIKHYDSNFELSELEDVMPEDVKRAYCDYNDNIVNEWLFDYCFGDIVEEEI